MLILIALLPLVSGLSQTISIITDASGNFSQQTARQVGQLEGIAFVNGNFTGNGTLNITDARGISIDSYNLSNGSVYRLPGVLFAGSTDAWAPIVPASKIWLNMTGQQDNATAEITVMWQN